MMYSSTHETNDISKVASTSDLTALTSQSSELSYDMMDETSIRTVDWPSLRSCMKSLDDSERSCSSDNRVRFSNVHIREYPICIGDNPSSTGGPPISIGWEFDSEKELSIDENEQKRKRNMNELALSELKRMVRLHKCGYHSSEIHKATVDVNCERTKRQETLEGLKWQKTHERVETVKRAILNATTKRSEKKRERQLLKPYKAASPICPRGVLGTVPVEVKAFAA